jgi:hypothetical protein
MFAKAAKIIREVLSEPNGGTLSWGRIASTVCLVAAIVWVSRVAFHNWSIPSLDGIATFVLGPYAANKVSTAAQSFSNNPVSAVQQNQVIPHV